MKGNRMWSKMPLACLALGFWVSSAGFWAAAPARADEAADRSAIAERLRDWAAAFNRKDSAAVCDLFAADLVQTVPEVPEGSRDEVCKRLDALFARTDASFNYAVDIREIIVSGDLAVVRLFWTLTAQSGQKPADISREAGMDVFRREQDGKWRIIRFIAFTENGDT